MKNKFTTGLTHHLVDTTGNLATATPILAGLELLVGVPEDVSLKARYLGLITGYGGLQFITRKIRDYSRKKKGITTKSEENTQHSHDRLNAAILTIVSSPFSYLVAEHFSNQDISVPEIAYVTLTRAGFAYFVGGIATYSEHAFRDLLCEEKKERISPAVYNLRKSERITLTALLLAASIALTSSFYYLHQEKTETQINTNVSTELYNGE